MPIRNFQISHRVTLDGFSSTVIDVSQQMSYDNSSRVAGKLRLVPHEHTLIRRRVMRFAPLTGLGVATLPFTGGEVCGPSQSSPFTDARDRLMASTYGSFRKKLYQGSASLGVTAGTYRESRQMITDRYEKLNRTATNYISDLSRMSPKGLARQAAGAHLEVVFGWVPLLSDIHSASTTVIQLADPHPVHIKSSQRAVVSYNQGSKNNDQYVLRSLTGRVKVTRDAMARVSNQNLWLAERAGLLNPAAVAWDLVPWSFVVNMFVNTGQLVNSITDFTGLTFYNESLTTNCESYVDHNSFVRYGSYQTPVSVGVAVTSCKEKYRTLGATARPPLILKLPDVNWELAAIAGSLFTQKIGVINKLFNSIKKA